MNTTIALFVPIAKYVFGLLGLGCVVWALRLVLVADDSRTWRMTDGELVETRVVMRPVKMRSGMMRVTVKELFHVEVQYTYYVDGHTYSGNRFRVGQANLSVASHRDGERITSAIKTSDLKVYYDPENPESSALQRGGSNAQILGLLAIGLLLVILAVGMFIIVK